MNLDPALDLPSQTPASSSSIAAPAVWDEARLWHAGFALGLPTAAASLLIGLGGLPPLILAALLAGAIPGVVGWALGSRAASCALPLLVLWAGVGALAAGLTGGLGGPLGLWCALPLVAALVFAGERLKVGTILALGAAVLVAALQYFGRLPAAPPMPAAGLAGGVGILALVIAAARAITSLYARLREAEAERALIARFAAELPVLALALDRDGIVEAAYGSGVVGLDDAALDAGLVEAAVPEDRALLRATLWEAMDHGGAETVFRPAAAPTQRVSLSLRRSGEEGLSGVLRELAAASAEPDAVQDERLAAVVAERDAALASAQAKARFLANMSHELRTPLNAIMGFSDIMRSRLFGELSTRYGEYAELIHESGRHLLDLINDVLDMSKIEADRYVLSIEDFDAREPVAAALRLVRLQADEAGVTLRGVLPNDPLIVEADRRAMKQTVLNLVSNALKFTPRGGQVTVTLSAVDARTLELSVADTGVGIAEEDLARLGQPYEQAGASGQRALGTGLGLSLVKALAQLHGGSMEIESQLGEGACVTARLPVLIDEADAEDDHPILPFESAPPPVLTAPPEPDLPEPEQPASSAEVIPLNLIRPNFGGGGPPSVA